MVSKLRGTQIIHILLLSLMTYKPLLTYVDNNGNMTSLDERLRSIIIKHFFVKLKTRTKVVHKL